ncbi:MAG: proton-conducting transporter membrane subunit [Proteobacteria bacterium]|nr:proton-conducting transporter membrane subunit [Pseudomonadota bacterium]
MELQLNLLILLPLAGFIIEIIVPRFFKRMEGFSSILFSLLTMCLAFFFCSNFDTNLKGVQFIYKYPWIPGWEINFKLALDGIGCIGIMLISTVFFILSIISKIDKKDYRYYSMIMLLQAFVMGFLVSYDFILKILFWEASWIPIFFLLIISVKKRFALLYSKYWFLSEFLIIVACILLFNNTGVSYDLEKIVQIKIGGERIFSVIFFFMMAGIMIRAFIFPFDSFLNKSIQACEHNVSIILGAIMPILPFFFMTSVMLPLFQKEMFNYTNILAIILLISIFICAIKLFIDKKISTIVSTQILLFNAMTFIWLIRPTNNLLQASFEIIVIKALFNIALIYFGRLIILEYKIKNNFDRWMFVICLILSFGLPGIIMTAPLFTLISSWYGIAPYVSILLMVFLMFIFLYTCINIIPLFNPKEPSSGYKAVLSVKNILFLIMIFVSLSISIWPDYIHYFSKNYYRTFIGRNY